MSQANTSFRVSAVLAGVAVDIVATYAALFALGFALGLRLAQGGAAPQEAGAAVQAWMETTPGRLVGMGLGGAATVAGAWVAARMGSHAPMRHAGAVGVVGVGLGLLSVQITGTGFGPWELLALGLTACAAWLGGSLAGRGAASASAPSRAIA